MRIRYISLVVVLLALSSVLTASAGTTGNLNSPGLPPAPVEKTDQTTKYADGDDGEYQKGVAWPNPRFTDNGNGTVTDNLTGLVWLKKANCMEFFFGDSTGQNRRFWSDALTAANSLEAGYCELLDGSGLGDWRLPNVKELESLIHYGVDDPALPNTSGTGKWMNGDPFTDVQSDCYWSSTTSEGSVGSQRWASGVDMYHGNVSGGVKYERYYYVWPVRDDGGTYPAPVEKTGQIGCWGDNGQPEDCQGTGQDGEYQEGVDWPDPRFTDNGNGTVTDNLTWLTWLKNANCMGFFSGDSTGQNRRFWSDALIAANSLKEGYCGLTDGSIAGDWRLPNARELSSLADFSQQGPALPSGHPFIGVQSGEVDYYWSSTTVATDTASAWFLRIHYGNITDTVKTDAHYVWPVRGYYDVFLPVILKNSAFEPSAEVWYKEVLR